MPCRRAGAPCSTTSCSARPAATVLAEAVEPSPDPRTAPTRRTDREEGDLDGGRRRQPTAVTGAGATRTR